MRVALYWAPAPTDPLHGAGSAWLGRDAEHDTTTGQPPIKGIAEATAAPALYGFHATLRPPMRLATGWPEFMAAADRVARSTAPFELPKLALDIMDGALALRETAPCAAMHALADACVQETDRHRLPPSDAELARRRGTGLSPTQDALLLRWGYPYVMAQWRFHMTLTSRLAPEARTILHQAATSHFATALSLPRRIHDLCVFTQPEPDTPFLLAERLSLTP